MDNQTTLMDTPQAPLFARLATQPLTAFEAEDAAGPARSKLPARSVSLSVRPPLQTSASFGSDSDKPLPGTPRSVGRNAGFVLTAASEMSEDEELDVGGMEAEEESRVRATSPPPRPATSLDTLGMVRPLSSMASPVMGTPPKFSRSVSGPVLKTAGVSVVDSTGSAANSPVLRSAGETIQAGTRVPLPRQSVVPPRNHSDSRATASVPPVPAFSSATDHLASPGPQSPVGAMEPNPALMQSQSAEIQDAAVMPEKLSTVEMVGGDTEELIMSGPEGREVNGTLEANEDKAGLESVPLVQDLKTDPVEVDTAAEPTSPIADQKVEDTQKLAVNDQPPKAISLDSPSEPATPSTDTLDHRIALEPPAEITDSPKPSPPATEVASGNVPEAETAKPSTVAPVLLAVNDTQETPPRSIQPLPTFAPAFKPMHTSTSTSSTLAVPTTVPIAPTTPEGPKKRTAISTPTNLLDSTMSLPVTNTEIELDSSAKAVETADTPEVAPSPVHVTPPAIEIGKYAYDDDDGDDGLTPPLSPMGPIMSDEFKAATAPPSLPTVPPKDEKHNSVDSSEGPDTPSPPALPEKQPLTLTMPPRKESVGALGHEVSPSARVAAAAAALTASTRDGSKDAKLSPSAMTTGGPVSRTPSVGTATAALAAMAAKAEVSSLFGAEGTVEPIPPVPPLPDMVSPSRASIAPTLPDKDIVASPPRKESLQANNRQKSTNAQSPVKTPLSTPLRSNTTTISPAWTPRTTPLRSNTSDAISPRNLRPVGTPTRTPSSIRTRTPTTPDTPGSINSEATLDEFMGLFKTVITRDKGMSIRDAARKAEQERPVV